MDSSHTSRLTPNQASAIVVDPCLSGAKDGSCPKQPDNWNQHKSIQGRSQEVYSTKCSLLLERLKAPCMKISVNQTGLVGLSQADHRHVGLGLPRKASAPYPNMHRALPEPQVGLTHEHGYLSHDAEKGVSIKAEPLLAGAESGGQGSRSGSCYTMSHNCHDSWRYRSYYLQQEVGIIHPPTSYPYLDQHPSSHQHPSNQRDYQQAPTSRVPPSYARHELSNGFQQPWMPPVNNPTQVERRHHVIPSQSNQSESTQCCYIDQYFNSNNNNNINNNTTTTNSNNTNNSSSTAHSSPSFKDADLSRPGGTYRFGSVSESQTNHSVKSEADPVNGVDIVEDPTRMRRKPRKEIGKHLSQADAERVRSLRERNRIAAAKCRNKMFEKEIMLERLASQLEADTQVIASRVQSLQAQRVRLAAMLSNHQCVQPHTTDSAHQENKEDRFPEK